MFSGLIYDEIVLLMFDAFGKYSTISIAEYTNELFGDLRAVHCVYFRPPFHVNTTALPLLGSAVRFLILLVDGYILAFSVTITEDVLINILLQLSFIHFKTIR